MAKKNPKPKKKRNEPKNRWKPGRRTCPKCGPGVYLAEHKDRWSCGKCGYYEKK